MSTAMRLQHVVFFLAGLGACGWQLASAFAGASLKPTIGVCYEPSPSDFTSWQQGGIYPPTGADFANDDFSQLWGSGGRNDLQTMSSWGANAVRLYNMKTYLKHVNFFNRAAELNMKVLASVSNEMLLGGNIDSAIPQLVNEIKGTASVAAWVVSNELSADSRCKPMSNCLGTLTKAVKLVADLDPGRPVMVVTVFDGGFESAKVVRRALAAAYPDLTNTRFIMGINMYFQEDPSYQRAILTNVLKQYFSNPELMNTPLMITEYGRPSVAPYSPQSQAAAISAQASTLAEFARGQDFPLFLGSFLFIFSDDNLQGSHNTYGVMAYSGNKAKANGGRGAYTVDELTCKPGCQAFQNAVGGGGGGGSVCPQVTGYTLTTGADHNGDDINCQPIDSATTAANRCKGDSACKSFNIYKANGASWACTKRVSGPVSPASGICFYTKGSSQNCPEVTGYTVATGVDHYGDDITCQTTDTANAAASRCSADPACMAFNTYGVNGTAWACTKRVASSVSAKAGVCFYTKPATNNCPQVAGYTLNAGADHFGDDITCQPTDSATVAAGRCSGDSSCKSFNTYTDSGALWACTKLVSGPTTSSAGICFYTKSTISCPQVAGYTSATDVDHYGDDITCQTTDSATTAAGRCTGDNGCKAFNTYTVNGANWACTKSVSGPTSPNKGICFYTKTTNSCPQVSGYTLNTDTDHTGDDINCQPTSSVDAAASRCNGDGTCTAFNSYAVNGVAWACTKRAASPAAPKPGICFYTKASTASCPQVSGYTLNTGVDHFGDDISCQLTSSAQTAASRCSGDSACKAFNTYTSGGAGWSCTKRVTGPTSTSAGICFYTKIDNGPGPNTCALSGNTNGGRTLYVQNKCSQTVWLTVLANAGKSPYSSETLFAMAPGSCQNLPLPANWAGRFYGKIGCNNGACLPGPFSLAEINFQSGADDFYDVSLVDGYNLPMTFTPVDAQGRFISGASDRRCTMAGCTSDLLRTCPTDLQVRGGPGNGVVACKSACSRYGSPQYCCTGSFACGPQCCPPTDFSRIFSAACPYAYSYAYDDKAGTFTCPNSSASGGYQLNFCM